MRIGLVGGTGREGRGLGARWARAGHTVVLGSRDAVRGRERAGELSARYGVDMLGGDNEHAVAGADVVVLCVPYSAHRETLDQLAPSLGGRVVLDITVPLRPPAVTRVSLPGGNAAALEAAAALPGARVVAALHHVSSAHLEDLDHVIDCDVLVCGDDPAAREVIASLVRDLGLRPVDAGVLDNAIALEALTPVLLHVNRHYKVKAAGVRITGLS
jgi:NADPH-dependent F420 reductase